MNTDALSRKLRVAVVGASGFTGKETLLWLGRHPNAEIVTVMSARPSEDPGAKSLLDRKDSSYAGAMREPDAIPYDPEGLRGLDCVFVCTPHERAAQIVPDFIDDVTTVIDLSAGFRLKDPGAYETFYGFTHPSTQLLEDRVYGLCEWAPRRPARSPADRQSRLLRHVRPAAGARARRGQPARSERRHHRGLQVRRVGRGQGADARDALLQRARRLPRLRCRHASTRAGDPSGARIGPPLLHAAPIAGLSRGSSRRCTFAHTWTSTTSVSAKS
jgi:hypothetical protein